MNDKIFTLLGIFLLGMISSWIIRKTKLLIKTLLIKTMISEIKQRNDKNACDIYDMQIEIKKLRRPPKPAE